MRTCILVCLGSLILTCAGGCIEAKAPENIYIGSGPRSENVDSSRVPQTHSHEEAQAELEKAYRQIQYLEHQNERLQRKYDDAKRDKDDYKRRYEDLKDRYED